MKLETKKRLVRDLLVIAAIWPLAQFALTKAFDVSPWKLFGWAMYTGPQFATEAKVLEIRASTLIEIEREKLTPEIQGELVKFEHRRIALGRLARPNRIGEMALEAYPNLNGVMVLAFRRHLNRETARIEMKSDSYPYFRDLEQE